LEDNTLINYNCVFLAKHGVEIGSNMWMAPNVHLYTELPSLIRKEFRDLVPEGSIKIGKSCWIGGGVKILPGVTIGDETVIGAGSFVTESIPSGVVAAGFPCKIRKAVKDVAPWDETLPTHAVDMTEMDKMLNGLPCVFSPELGRISDIADEISLRFNESGDQTILEELFQQKLSGVKVELPFYSAFGMFIKLGGNVAIGSGCMFLSPGGIEIGDHTIFEPQVQLYTAEHPIDPIKRNAGIFSAKKIKIGANCHIGRGAIIVSGVEIGDSANVLEGSVVTKNVPAGTTVGGSPAKVIEVSKRK
jgi:maltose O-acetyltransferase